MADLCSRLQFALLGAGNVGKTTLLHKYLYGSSKEVYGETVEETHVYPYNMKGKQIFIEFIDTAGSISFPAMRQLYVSKADGFMLVYSLSDAQSFEEVKAIWKRIKESGRELQNIPCVIVGNKLDKDSIREVERSDVNEWAGRENLGSYFEETSAEDSAGISKTFNILLKQIGQNHVQKNESIRTRSTSFSERNIKKKHIPEPSKETLTKNKLNQNVSTTFVDNQKLDVVKFTKYDPNQNSIDTGTYSASFRNSPGEVRKNNDRLFRRCYSFSAKVRTKHKEEQLLVDKNRNSNVIKRLSESDNSTPELHENDMPNENKKIHAKDKLSLGTFVLAYWKFCKSLRIKRQKE